MQVKDIEVEKLIPYVNNPRRNDEAVDYVAASIKEFGFKVPVVIDKENVIVAGHTRVKAAKKLGLESVPCVIADDLTENQIKAFRLADNKVGELATWDFEKLELELQALDLDMVSFGFEEDEEKKEIERKRKEFAERLAAGEIREEDEEYQAFLEKFEPKKTTDDCFTPPKVYAAVVKYVEKMYGVKERDIVRPFYPGGDYQNEKYPKGVGGRGQSTILNTCGNPQVLRRKEDQLLPVCSGAYTLLFFFFFDGSLCWRFDHLRERRVRQYFVSD
jgi:hypothetical protein